MKDQKKRTFNVKIKNIYCNDRLEYILDGVRYCRKIHRIKDDKTTFKITENKFSNERWMSPELIEYMKKNFGFKDGDDILITKFL